MPRQKALKKKHNPAPPAPAKALSTTKHRPTRGEVEQRVNSIVTMIATRSRHEEICRFASSQWGVTPRQTDRYIRLANAIILAEAAKDRATRIAEHLAALDAIVKRAYAIDDLTSMRAAIAEKSKLCGDYPTERMRLDVYDWRKEAEAAGVNPEEALNELERIIASEMEKRNDGGGDTEYQDAEKMDASPVADSTSR